MNNRIGRGVLLLVGLAVLAHGETWQTSRGPVEGHLVATYGPMVVITTQSGTAIFSVEALSSAELARVAAFRAQQPATPVAWKDSKSKVARAVVRRLEVLANGKAAAYDPGLRIEPELYVIYFGAFWCGPCRRFSPGFVQTYGRLQQEFPGRFEAIFVSSDNDRSEQVKYMNEVKMPWPVLRYSALGSADVVERWAGRGIPCLAVLTRDGDLLFHSYHGDEYVGPQQTLKELEAFLAASDPRRVSTRKALYRLAVLDYVRNAGAASLPPKPYLIALDPSRYRTLEADELTATLEIDDQGTVTNASFEPKQSAVIDYQLVDDASHWLFLPAVKDGHATAMTVKVPVQMK